MGKVRDDPNCLTLLAPVATRDVRFRLDQTAANRFTAWFVFVRTIIRIQNPLIETAVQANLVQVQARLVDQLKTINSKLDAIMGALDV